MIALDNPRHERFAQFVAKGMEQAQAYREAGFSSVGEAAKANASRLMKDEGVAARVAELKAETERECRISKRKLMDYLCDVLEVPAGEVQEDHKLCQAYKHTESERSIKMPDKLRAAELLAKLCGWNEPEKVTHEAGDALLDLLSRVRSRS